MDTMIQDAVTQLKASIDKSRAAQARLYGSGQAVVVRFTSTVRGRQLTTWSPATVVAAVVNDDSWFYRVKMTDSRGLHHYTVVGGNAVRSA